MKLEKKKDLVSRTLDIGKTRITFNVERLSDIKEAITKQDIKDLVKDGAIIIKSPKGRKAVVKRNNRRRAGSIKQKATNKKRLYMIITRKLRAYTKSLLEKDKISKEDYYTLRKEIRTKAFRSLAHFKERVHQLGDKE